MQENDAPAEAIKFVRAMNGEGFLLEFSEKGTVDLGGAFYPQRANGNFQTVFLNGTPPVIPADELPAAIHSAIEMNHVYRSLKRQNPSLSLWTWNGKREGIQQLALGWQRFLFSYPLKTCNACDVLGTAFVAFDFSETGEFLGTKLLFVTEDYQGGKDRLKESISVDPNEDLIAYFWEDIRWREHSGDFLGSSIWYVHPDGSGQRKVISFDEPVWNLTWSPNGKYLIYTAVGTGYTHVVLDLQGNILYRIEGAVSDLDWSPQGDHIVYLDVNDPGNRFSQLVILEIQTGKTRQVTSSPTLKKKVEWSPDGQQLAFTTYEGVFITDLENKVEEWLIEVPDGTAILWEDEGIFFSKYEEESILKVISIPSCEISRLVPISSGGWSQAYSPIQHSFCDACRDSSGLCTIQVDKQKPEVTVIAEDVSPHYCVWSPDGERVIYGTGSFRDEDIAIYVMDTNGDNSRKIASGAGARWRPTTGTSLDASDLISAKRETIDALENASVEVMGVPISVRAFDETDARALVETLAGRVGEDSLEDAQAEAFRRVILQEEAIAKMFPHYTRASADLTDGGTTMAGSLIVLNDRAEKIMSDAAQAPHRYTKAWWYLRRLVSRKILNVLDGLVRLTISTLPDEASQEDMRMFWDVLITGIRTNADTGVAVKDILLGTVVKQPVVNSVVGQLYVDRLQPSLNKGIRSADPDQGADSWPVEGDAQRAEIHIDSLARQAEMEADNAHQTHEALMRGVDTAQLAADIAELGELTPAAALARASKIDAKIMSLGVDATALVVAWRSMDCTYYLSTHAGPLAFDPNQPGESCRDRGSWTQPTTGRLASQRLPSGDGAAWNAATVELEANREAYQVAVEDVVAAIRDESPQSVEEALAILDDVDGEVSQQMRNAVTLSLAQDEGMGNTDAIVEGQGQFASDALNFYLLTAAALMEAEDESPSLTEVEAAAEAAVTSLERFNEKFRLSSPTVSVEAPIPTISDVLTTFGEGNKPFEVRATVENIGSAESGDLLLKPSCDGEDVEVRTVSGLEPNQQIEVSFECPRESSTVLIQLEEQERVADVRVKFFDHSHSATASNSVWQTIRNALPFVCGFTAILFVVVLVVGIWRAKRR